MWKVRRRRQPSRLRARRTRLGPSNAQEETRVNPEPNDTSATRSDPKPPADADDHDAMPPVRHQTAPHRRSRYHEHCDAADKSTPAKEASRGEDAEPAPSPSQPLPEALQAWADAAIKQMTDNASKINVNSNLRGTVDLRMSDTRGWSDHIYYPGEACQEWIFELYIAADSPAVEPLSPPPDGKMHQLVLALSFPIETRYAPQEPGSEPDPSAAGRY